MSRLNPESSRDDFFVLHKLTGEPGNPYDFAVFMVVDGVQTCFEGLSMGDVVEMNRRLARAISQARHDKREAER